MSESSEPPKSNEHSQARNAALTVCAVAILTQVPTTLSQISNPLIRGGSLLVAAAIILILGYFIIPKPRKK